MDCFKILKSVRQTTVTTPGQFLRYALKALRVEASEVRNVRGNNFPFLTNMSSFMMSILDDESDSGNRC